MQFDSSILLILIVHLTLILAVSWAASKRLHSSSGNVRYADPYLPSCLTGSSSPIHLQVKKYLIFRRKIKKANPDDDSPYSSLLVLAIIKHWRMMLKCIWLVQPFPSF